MTRIFEKCKHLASKSDHQHFKFGAVVTDGNKVVSCGYNTNRTHPKSPTPWQTRHAEVDAILKLKGRTGTCIYVLRYMQNGSYGNAKPCNDCMNFIRKNGIKFIIYTMNDGIWSMNLVA
jgi:deoxycytidylate deaminase